MNDLKESLKKELLAHLQYDSVFKIDQILDKWLEENFTTYGTRKAISKEALERTNPDDCKNYVTNQIAKDLAITIFRDAAKKFEYEERDNVILGAEVIVRIPKKEKK